MGTLFSILALLSKCFCHEYCVFAIIEGLASGGRVDVSRHPNGITPHPLVRPNHLRTLLAYEITKITIVWKLFIITKLKNIF